MRIAVVGAGISGLSCAHALNKRHEVRLFEARDRLGGHAHTQTVSLGSESIDVDTGFIVYNERNYPDLIQLFAELKVETIESDMSFAASVGNGHLEYCGSSLSALFAQPSNILKPRFLRMLADILRFNKLGSRALDQGLSPALTLESYLRQHRFDGYFLDAYLLPMGAAIWSMPVRDMLAFPAITFLRFFHNHGLLTVNGHPQWRTLNLRSADYVKRIAEGLKQVPITGDPVAQVLPVDQEIEIVLNSGWRERFDHVVLASHADESRKILDASFSRQRGYLGHFRFQSNDAVLHSDPALMPSRKRAWASWNYLTSRSATGDHRVSLTYWMNRLQSIDHRHPLFVTLNPQREPNPALVHNRMVYEHPVFDENAVSAQTRLDQVQGENGVWMAGAWLGYGFHEDGARSGLDVAAALGAPCSWQHRRQVKSWVQPEPLAA